MDRKLALLVLVFFLAFGTFVSTVVYNSPGAQFIRARNPQQLSTSNSLAFAVPPSTSAPGSCDVSIVVNDVENKAIPEAQVCVSSSLGTVAPGCTQTDKNGIAVFQIAAQTAGLAQISATINTTPLGKSVTCEFL